MNNIYGLRQDDAFQALVQVDDAGEIGYDDNVAIKATALCGEKFDGSFLPPKLSWGTPRKKKDCDLQAMLSPFLVFSKRALDALMPFLQASGQILPVQAPVDGMSGFHVTRVLEGAVDMDASKFKVYPQATVFNKIVLLEKRVRDVDMFRLKEKPATVFVSEKFRRAVEASNLKGFDFGEVILQSAERG
ncbi:double-CXXCG motif protein [Burkholderia multivorans]|uniref:double-CXXCG motif protein n=1 Tax=Burkholderia multivorans TaxID=87883 RepID=UPI001C242DDD|nr:double-CXXCG motif protein [Burkholderia multivorans]MBU9119282.1 double-CXXCG motif protein [Burkholderia multivorans]